MSFRIVIYPLFGAGADETDELLEKLADVLVSHHGRAESEDDDVKSIVAVFDDDELGPGDDAAGWFAENHERMRCVIMPGAGLRDEGAVG